MYKDYGLTKKEWSEIKNEVIKDNRTSSFMIGKHQLGRKQTWFLYDILLQEKYNHLYKREKLVNPKVGDFVYCDYEGFGRGEIKKIIHCSNTMFIKFDKRELATFCDSIHMYTVLDDVKRKITRI